MAKKILKKTLLALTCVFVLLCLNLAYFVFIGQNKAMAKVKKNINLDLYEMCSIYQMHLSTLTVGSFMAPEAAKELLKMHFPHKGVSEKVYIKAGDGFWKSEKLQKAIKDLEKKKVGSSVSVSWNGYETYNIRSVECRASIAVNPCKVVKVAETETSYNVEVSCPAHYPNMKKATPINAGLFTVWLHEGLFRYLEDKGWLFPYLAVYQNTIKK